MKNNDIYFVTETGRCILCYDASCSMACKKMDVSSIIRSARFNNLDGAVSRIPAVDVCVQCERQACISSLLGSKFHVAETSAPPHFQCLT